ncbi:MAG: hypothetical protein J6U54_08210 [Clostridiales bacterium]|nr:hypothetical protein [Clostridiales bacterium]
MMNEERLKGNIKSLKEMIIITAGLLAVSIIACVVSSLMVSKIRPDYIEETAKVVNVGVDVELSSAKYGKTDSKQVVIVSYKGNDTKLIGAKNIKWYVDAYNDGKEVPVYEYQSELYADPDAIKSTTTPVKVRGLSVLMIFISFTLTIAFIIALVNCKSRYAECLMKKEQLKKEEANKVVHKPIKRTKAVPEPKEQYIDDLTFIKAMKHIKGPWHQYEILIDARIYGWDHMIDWAEYMAGADIDPVDQVTASHLGEDTRDLSSEYKETKSFKAMESLKEEMGNLSIAGTSKILNGPLKIVFFNQTRMLRLFSMIDDDLLMKKYAETMIRRNFGKPGEMMLGKPSPEKK